VLSLFLQRSEERERGSGERVSLPGWVVAGERKREREERVVEGLQFGKRATSERRV